MLLLIAITATMLLLALKLAGALVISYWLVFLPMMIWAVVAALLILFWSWFLGHVTRSFLRWMNEPVRFK